MAKWQLILANLFGALGSGWILATGLELSAFHDEAWGDSILAFLLGGCCSVLVSTYKRKAGLQVPAQLFSFLSVAILLPLVPAWSSFVLIHPAVLVTLLSLFFCFTFLARAERIAVASQTPSLIFPVELAYALGTSISLFALAAVTIKTSSMIVLVGGTLCAVAFFLDLLSPKSVHARSATSKVSSGNFSILPVALELSALTIATQVVSQMISQRLKSPAPLGAFDAGTTLAPILCSFLGATLIRERLKLKSGVEMEWASLSRWVIGLMFFCCCLLLASNDSPKVFWALLPTVFLAAVIYEAQCLVKLEAVGSTEEGRQAIPVIFSCMAVAATLTYSLFLIGNIGTFGILAIVLGLFAFQNLPLLPRLQRT